MVGDSGATDVVQKGACQVLLFGVGSRVQGGGRVREPELIPSEIWVLGRCPEEPGVEHLLLPDICSHFSIFSTLSHFFPDELRKEILLLVFYR